MTGRQNVLLITVDSLRADRCGYMGHTGGLTPTIDRLANEGLQFDNAIAPAGATGGSMPAIMTGCYPFNRDDDGLDAERRRQHLKSRGTIAKQFRQMGYETAAFTANPWASRRFGFDYGFDHFEDFFDDALTEQFRIDSDGGPVRTSIERMVNWWHGQKMFLSWESYYDDILDWIESASEPYFLWVFTVDVHSPYLPPEGYRRLSLPTAYAANSWLYRGANPKLRRLFREPLISLYDDTIRYTDRLIERLVSDVGRDSLLCVHADHGELFGERGSYLHGPLYEPVVNVPLVVGNAPTETVTDPVSLRRLPELLTGLAAGDRPEVSEPYVTARNNDGARLVRGANWRYERMPEGEAVMVGQNGDWEAQSDHPLYEVGREIADRAARTDRERTEIVRTVQTVSESVSPSPNR